MAKNWTSHNGWTNSSPKFVELCDEVEQIIRNGTHVDVTARLIMSQLAHVHGLAPTK